MPADAVSEIKSRLDIIDVIGSYVRLERRGRDHKALCPFHSERTPSFGVSQAKQIWYCFGCQEGGDVFTFVQKHEHLDFAQALELLAERAGVELERSGADRRGSGQRKRRGLELNARAQTFFEHVLWSTDTGGPGRELLAARQVPVELARVFGVGFAPGGGTGGDALVRWMVSRGHAAAEEVVAAGLAHPGDRGGARDRFRGRLVFPIRDERGQVVGFGGRALGDAVPKYLNTPATDAYDKSVALFGIDLARAAIGPARCAVLVEGYFDVVASHAAGVRHAVASSGTALTSGQVRLLARFTDTVVLCFDADDAGRAAASRAVDVLAQEGLEARLVALPPGVKDPDELVRQDPQAFVAAVEEAAPAWQVLLDAALGAAEAGSVEERRGGSERAVTLLARIPEASARELYTQQAARRLGLPPSTLSADVSARLARQQRGGAVPRLVVPAPASRVAPAPSGAVAGRPAGGSAGPGPGVSAWEEHIGCLVVQRPGLAAVLVAGHGLRPADLVSPAVRRMAEVALELGAGEDFPIHRIEDAEQALVARLSMRPVPELAEDADPDELDLLCAELVRRVRQAALGAELRAIKLELRVHRDAGRSAEADELGVRCTRLAAELQALATPVPGHARRADPSSPAAATSR